MSDIIQSIMKQPAIFLTIAMYLAGMVGIGFWANAVGNKARKGLGGNFLEEYFLAGRSMGGFALAMSLVTTYTSASSFIGGPGIAYTLGLGWILLVVIQIPTTFLTLGVLGRRFADFGRKTGALTISQFLQSRYQSGVLVSVTSLFMIVFFVAIMLAQFIGGARLFQAITGTPYVAGLLLFGLTVVVYTTIGGFRAVVLTDIVQGVVMLFASVAVLWGVVDAGGGLTNVMRTLEAIDPGLLRPSGDGGGTPAPFLLSFWVLIGLGVLGLPQTAQKCLAFKDNASMRNAMVYGTVVIGFILLATHLTGVFGRAVLPDLPVGDLVMPTLIVQLLPPVLSGMFVAGVLAAIMSTVSSMLIIASATLIRDLYLQWYLGGDQSRADAKFIRKASLGITAFLGVCVFVLALNPPDLLAWINLFAFGGLEAVFLWPVVLGLFWKKANSTGALCSVCVGLVCFMGLTVQKMPLGGVHPIAPSLVLAGFAFYMGNRFHRRLGSLLADEDCGRETD